ncbi:hypothetical protein ABZX95_49880, partial [Streptomyces sp. NPDC004232]|uniref:hypothetical protein n=1 Tax=Streptomyces sp. NPDC004232 TaxID=3154454 RepID=UPI0033AD1234
MGQTRHVPLTVEIRPSDQQDPSQSAVIQRSNLFGTALGTEWGQLPLSDHDMKIAKWCQLKLGGFQRPSQHGDHSSVATSLAKRSAGVCQPRV